LRSVEIASALSAFTNLWRIAGGFEASQLAEQFGSGLITGHESDRAHMLHHKWVVPLGEQLLAQPDEHRGVAVDERSLELGEADILSKLRSTASHGRLQFPTIDLRSGNPEDVGDILGRAAPPRHTLDLQLDGTERFGGAPCHN
jgi:hypothetical protein